LLPQIQRDFEAYLNVKRAKVAPASRRRRPQKHPPLQRPAGWGLP